MERRSCSFHFSAKTVKSAEILKPMEVNKKMPILWLHHFNVHQNCKRLPSFISYKSSHSTHTQRHFHANPPAKL